MPTDHYIKLVSNNPAETRSIRANGSPAHINGARIGQINIGAFAKATVGASYTYTANVLAADGTMQAQAGDIWHAVYEANGVAIVGWCAEIHKGTRYTNVTVVGEPTPPVDPPAFVYPDTIDDTISIPATDTTPAVVYKGTLYKQD